MDDGLRAALEATAEEAETSRHSEAPELPNAADLISAFEEMLRRGRKDEPGAS